MPGQERFCDPTYETNAHVVRGEPGWVVTNCEDLARVGLLVATKGMWKARRLLDAQFLPDLHRGVGIHLTAGDSDSHGAIGSINREGLPSLEDCREAVTGPVTSCESTDG